MTQKKVFFYWGWPDALEQQFREPTADFIGSIIFLVGFEDTAESNAVSC